MDRQIDKIPTGNDARPGELAVAGECAGAGKLHRTVRHSFERPQPARSVGGTAGRRTGTNGGSTLEEVERDHILRVFRETGGVISAAATRLGMPRTTLNAMMKKLGISRSDL